MSCDEAEVCYSYLVVIHFWLVYIDLEYNLFGIGKA